MICMNTSSCGNSGQLVVTTLRRSVWQGAMAAMLWLATGTHADAAGRVGAIGSAAVDCDRTGWQSVREPAAAPRGVARAHWLSAGLIRWPGADPAGRYRLLHSARGQINASIGAHATGVDASLALQPFTGTLPSALAERFKFVAEGATLALPADAQAQLRSMLSGQWLLVQEDTNDTVVAATRLQWAGGLDDLFAAAASHELGVQTRPGGTSFALWAPTAQAVSVCVYRRGIGPASQRLAMQTDPATGIWSAALPGDLSGRYFAYLVDVFVDGVGTVRNRVTDPYSVSLTTDSKRSYIADLDAPSLQPAGWAADRAAMHAKAPAFAATDSVIYELHLRDFSIGDASVPPAHRGKYLAFTDLASNGMKHLRALAQAGLTDVHLLPVFDFATVPESGCITPTVQGGPASALQQASVMAAAARDCFNWGYDPWHFSAPEGSYASDAADGAVRVREFRRMVMALHASGLRVGMDVVYNHTAASGQHERSVLDRIVPGYYHRLDADGEVERSTCCDNTATEHLMMGKLMTDSVLLWATHYGIDSFRFDLMGHQPRALMVALKSRLEAATGREVPLIGEGWNFGEVAGGARFVQASQLSLNGSGIATFSDRARDAVRGGGPSDGNAALRSEQGYINGLVYDPSAAADPMRPRSDLMRIADQVRVGLAGSLRGFEFTTFDGTRKRLDAIDYAGQPAGYANAPFEVVNYVENHDNTTLFDLNVYKLPLATGREDRARVQMLGAAIVAFSQGVAYFHAGIDTLRSKSMDRNSFDSGDWFNRLDWRYRNNHFGSGLPPQRDNLEQWPLLKTLLTNARIAARPENIAWARDAFKDLLAIRASSSLFRLRSAEAIKSRLTFPNSGRDQQPEVLVGRLEGEGLAGARFKRLMYFVNVDKIAHTLTLPAEAGQPWVLHPVHRRVGAADPRPQREAVFESATGRFTLPPRTALVYVNEL
jgi:pullulanase